LPKLVIAKESKLRRFEGVSGAGAFSRNPELKAKDLEQTISAIFGNTGNFGSRTRFLRI
jgi:hypothetical protein